MNLKELINRIELSGLKPSFIASKCHLTRAGLRKKLLGKTEFKRNEISSLKTLLGLSPKEVCDIFFENQVDFKSMKGDNTWE